MRFVLHLLAMMVVALGVGFGLSWFFLTEGSRIGALEVGPWAAWPDAGAPVPNPYTRAFLARSGTLQLGQSEGLQFVATTDSEGSRLTAHCNYAISGVTPQAAFWTLVALDPAGVNVARPDGPAALRSNGLVREPDGSVVLHVGPQLSPGNWLETAGQGPFSLALTLYGSSLFAGLGSTVEALPSIRNEGCQ